jgi:hypothetical protein
MKYLILPIMGALFVLVISGQATATDVKYCKDYTTGEIYVVEANMPCPYPTVEI